MTLTLFECLGEDTETSFWSTMARKSHGSASRLHLEVMPTAQRKLWDDLGSTPSQFVLYGGTAIALRLGHRASEDFDFFTTEPFDPATLLDTVPYLKGAEVFQLAKDTLSVTTRHGKGVKVSFFCPPRPLRIAGSEYLSTSPRLRLAPLIDLAATKVNVIFQRAAAKDYIDLHALVTVGGIDLLAALVAVNFVFEGQSFNPFVALKALTYFDDMEFKSVPLNVQKGLGRAVAKIDMSAYDAAVEDYRHAPGRWKMFP